mgnify:CR=1 FL=1
MGGEVCRRGELPPGVIEDFKWADYVGWAQDRKYDEGGSGGYKKGSKKRWTVKGMRAAPLSPSSDWPKVDVRSLNTPMMVNCRPWILMICPVELDVEPKMVMASLSSNMATFWRRAMSEGPKKRPLRVTNWRLRTWE